jgi:hypothetical protein
MESIERELEAAGSVRAITAFALCCGERVLPLCRLGVDDLLFGRLQTFLDGSWARFSEQPTDGWNMQVGAGREILDSLEDADFGQNHIAVFDAMTVLGHSVYCVGQSSLAGVQSEAKLSVRGMFRLLQGVYSEQYGMFHGWRDHESVRRELAWQTRDLRLLHGNSDPRVIEIVRGRAVREAQLLVDGVVNRDWSTSLPSEGWPTLF